MPSFGRPKNAKPLGPRSEAKYRETVLHCFGSLEAPFTLKADVSKVGPSRRLALRAATVWACQRAGVDPEPVLDQFPAAQWAPQRAVEIPAEGEIVGWEEAAQQLPTGRRAGVFLPLRMGLRSQEVMSLSRAAVQKAYDHGDLLVMRKGGKEQVLPAKHVQDLFAELLSVTRATPPMKIHERMAEFRSSMGGGRKFAGLHLVGQEPMVIGKPWRTVGEIFSTGDFNAQYQAFYQLVRRAGEQAGLKMMRPHKLRHVFATRMIRKGAPIATVQWYLGHSNVATTTRYLHMTGADAERFL